jgi:hypothetical protein
MHRILSLTLRGSGPLIILVTMARGRAAIRLAQPGGTRLPGLRIIGRDHLVIIMEMKIFVFLIPMRSGVGEVLRVVHGPTHVYAIRKAFKPL